MKSKYRTARRLNRDVPIRTLASRMADAGLNELLANAEGSQNDPAARKSIGSCGPDRR